MNCAYCKHVDGVVYTSLPPKYKCSITGDYHLALDDCDVDFEPVRHSKAIPHSNGGLTWWYICKSCKGEVDIQDKFCKHCGAIMDG